MKTLLLIRHAKSSWDNVGQSDIDRPLNERGKKDAPEMAKRLKNKKIKIDQFISSPAKRARATAKLFAAEFDVKKDEIKLVDDLYMASPGAFSTTVSALKNKHDAVALFSHNPGISEYAATLTDVRIDEMPTCSVLAVQADADKWSDFEQADKKFLFFDYPRNPESL